MALLAGIDLASCSWPLLLGAVAVLYYVISSVIAWRRLRHFDGPLSTSFSYIWLTHALGSGRMGAIFTETHTKYGSSTVRIGPNDLLTCDPDVIRRTSGARAKYTRSDFYRLTTMDPYEESMFNTLDTTTHDKLKAQTAAGYAGKENPGLEAQIDSVLAEVVNKIWIKYAAKSPTDKMPWFDLATMAGLFTLESISRVAFGEVIGLVREEKDLWGHLQMLEEVASTVNVVGGIPYLRSIFGSKLVLSFLAPKPGDKRGIGRVMPMAKSIVQKRFDARAEDEDNMLGSFIRHGLSQRQVEVEALFQIVAGSDTTATAIRATMLHVMTAPAVYRALQAEIDAGIKAGKISNPIKNSEAMELPYLQAVIFEGLRIHPPVTGLFSKVVPPQGEIIDGKPVPGGTRISPSFWATGRRRDVFGPDADLFRPERWLEAGKEERAEMRRVTELAFGYGRWGCAGKMIAFMELNKVFVELLRHFDFQLANPSRPWKSLNYSLFLQSEMWVAVTLREGVEEAN